jgi:hypothetical protein
MKALLRAQAGEAQAYRALKALYSIKALLRLYYKHKLAKRKLIELFSITIPGAYRALYQELIDKHSRSLSTSIAEAYRAL